MKTTTRAVSAGIGLLAVVILAGAPGAHADVVTDANAKAADIVSRIPAPPITVRMMAIVQVSVFEAVNAVTGRYPPQRAKLTPAPGASVEAAVAAATRTALSKLMPAQQAAIDADYQALLAPSPTAPRRPRASRSASRRRPRSWRSAPTTARSLPTTYRPHAAPGVYVPTMGPAVPHWGQAPPLGDDPRRSVPPGPPARAHQRHLGARLQRDQGGRARNSTQRTPEQTAIAKFWEATAPAVYWPVARSVAAVPGRDVTDNARLFALAAMAMDDALIAVFDAKYAYNFWRPVTAIRNGDLDGNDATDRDPGWTAVHRHADAPRVSVRPLHRVRRPWAPCSQPRSAPGPRPRSAPPAPPPGGAVRTWTSVDDFTQGGRGGAHLRRRALPQLDRGGHRDGQEDRRAGGEERAKGDPLTPPPRAG